MPQLRSCTLPPALCPLPLPPAKGASLVLHACTGWSGRSGAREEGLKKDGVKYGKHEAKGEGLGRGRNPRICFGEAQDLNTQFQSGAWVWRHWICVAERIGADLEGICTYTGGRSGTTVVE